MSEGASAPQTMTRTDWYALISGGSGTLSLALTIGAIPWVAAEGGHFVLPGVACAVIGLLFGIRPWPPAAHAGLARASCLLVNLFALLVAGFVASWFTQGG